MPVFFVDTSFWIALRKPRDPVYPAAIRWQRYVAANRIRLVTSDMVFWEFLNALSHPTTRQGAVANVFRARNEPTLEILPVFGDDALRFYASRPDKEWSLTDCHSLLVMRDRQITSALTSDHHFTQAGFEALLLTDPPEA